MTDTERAWHDRYRHPVAWNSDFPAESLAALFEEAARRHADRALIDFLGRRYSYAEVADGACRVATGLAALGFGKGDRIGLFLPNVPHYLAAYYGALRLGATVVNFSPLYTVDELAHQVADSGTRVLFTLSARALLPTALTVLERSGVERLIVGSVAGALPTSKSLFYRLFRRREVAPRPHDPRITAFSALIANAGDAPAAAIDAARDIALIQYTGGTTGVPKGAMLTHANLAANARQVNAIDPHRDAPDRILGVLPFFHVFANTCVLNRTVANGGEIVMLPRFDAGQVLAAMKRSTCPRVEAGQHHDLATIGDGTVEDAGVGEDVMLPRFDAGQVLAAMKRTRPTALPGVPTMYQALIDHPRFAATDFSSLRMCISGGAPLSAALAAKWRAATGAALVEGYGLSESSGVLTANPYEGNGKPGSIGQPIPATRLRLVDKEHPHRDAPLGEPGEIVARGPQIMAGYWNRPDADGETFVDGWLRTGDVGVIDDDGFLTIVDRLKDMIAVAGFKVFPSQIEAILYRHPAVKEAIVIGLPDAYRGEAPRAFVTLAGRGGVGGDGNGDGNGDVDWDVDWDGAALRDWLNPQLGKHERVDRVVVRESLPKTMIGKLSRKDLIAEVSEEHG